MRVSMGARLALLATLWGAAAHAQAPTASPETIAVGDWQIAPTLELRTRGEYRRDPLELGGIDATGADTARVRDAGGVLERTRVGLGAERGPLRAEVQLQDARVWGAPPPLGVLGSPGGNAVFGAQEAWFEARTSAARPSFLRVGRQTLSWGEGRLVGSADWSPA